MKVVAVIFFCFISISLFSQDSTAAKKTYLGILSLTEKYKIDNNWTKEDQAVLGQHFRRLVKSKDEGIVVLAGRTNLASAHPDLMGLVIFYAKNDEEALQFMMDDPCVKNKLMNAKVHPYGLAVSKCK